MEKFIYVKNVLNCPVDLDSIDLDSNIKHLYFFNPCRPTLPGKMMPVNQFCYFDVLFFLLILDVTVLIC